MAGGIGGGGAAANGVGTIVAAGPLALLRHYAIPSAQLTLLQGNSIGAAVTPVSTLSSTGGNTTSCWGSGGAGLTAAGNGNPGYGYGCGGGGAHSTAGTGPFNGGRGSPGAFVIRW